MNKNKWFLFGYSDQLFARSHPEAILQQAWIYLMKDIDNGAETWHSVFNGFPQYKKGVLQATKHLNLE